MEGRSFSEWLRAELDRQDVSINELARRWMPDNSENARRRIHQYLAGKRGAPRKPEVREAIARTLGVNEEDMP